MYSLVALDIRGRDKWLDIRELFEFKDESRIDGSLYPNIKSLVSEGISDDIESLESELADFDSGKVGRKSRIFLQDVSRALKESKGAVVLAISNGIVPENWPN